MKNNLSYRVEQLEKCQKEIQEKLCLILENHLPHIKEDLAALKSDVRAMTAINVGAIIIGLLVSRFIK